MSELRQGAGVLDSFTRAGKRPKVNVSSSFLVGMKVTVWRPIPGNWKRLAELTIAEVPVDAKRCPTNELIFTEPLPEGIRAGDVLTYKMPK
jgi:hypothetical protein